MSKTEVKEHTRLPWELHHEGSLRICAPEPATEQLCRTVAEAEILRIERNEANANAALIVTAVNSHYELLAAAEAALEWFAGFPHKGNASDFDRSTATHVYDELRTAISKAKGNSNEHVQ